MKNPPRSCHLLQVSSSSAPTSAPLPWSCYCRRICVEKNLDIEITDTNKWPEIKKTSFVLKVLLYANQYSFAPEALNRGRGRSVFSKMNVVFSEPSAKRLLSFGICTRIILLPCQKMFVEISLHYLLLQWLWLRYWGNYVKNEPMLEAHFSNSHGKC